MHSGTIDLILAAVTVVAALAVAAIGVLGFVVWLAGGKQDQRKDQKMT